MMLMQRLEDRNLRRIEERFDLLVGTLEERLHLLMFLLVGQAGVLEDRLELRISRDQNGFDLPLLDVAKSQLGRQPLHLLIGCWVMVMPLTWIGAGRLIGGGRVRRGLGQGKAGEQGECGK